MENKEIYFGFDMGTENIGFAVCDENYKVKKVNGRKAWGVRFFDTAETAVQRRTYRAARRRLERRKYRITLLQELFYEEIKKKDPNFFFKLNENDLHLEDKEYKTKYSLFNDENFTDKQFYKKYPTIYHLRNALMNEPASDIRLLYLAIHHIVKYRGNFLRSGEINDVTDATEFFEALNNALENLSSEVNDFDNDQKITDIGKFDLSRLNELTSLVKDYTIKRKDKILKAKELLSSKNTSQNKIIEAIFGGVVNVEQIFGKDKYDVELLSKAKFYLSEEVEEFLPILEGELNPTDYEIIVCMKNIYDWQVLLSLLKGKSTLSEAMVDTYNEHKKDLKNLKYIVEKYLPSEKDAMFGEPSTNGKIDDKIDNYTKYIGGGYYGGAKLGRKYEDGKLVVDTSVVSRNGRLGKTCTKEDFYKYVNKLLKNITIDENDEKGKRILEDIKSRIENGDFMPKIVSKDNATIPYQLNENELNKIIEVNKEKYPFLLSADDGIAVSKKIKSLLTFRMPYYVGPVKENANSKNVWAVRKESGRVTPWNLSDKIDLNESREKFITRMTCKCTYLKNEDVLPKNSVLFSKYVALNELNKLKVNDKEINVDLKQKIFNEVYLNKTVNRKNIAKCIKNITGNDVTLSGIDENLHGNMNTYQKMKKVIGDKVDKYPDMVEDIVKILTIFADDSKAVEELLKERYSSILSVDEIKKLKGFKYSGWGSFSRGLLQGSAMGTHGIMLTDSQGNLKDIIDIMWETNQNFMEIINNEEYDFADAVRRYEKENEITENLDITYDDVEELYCSPSVKRSIWQAFLMTKELVKLCGVPRKIFIETTRSNTDEKKKTRTQSRKEQITAMYEEAKKQDKYLYKEEIAEMMSKADKKSNGELNSEKIFLYFMQLGKDMYSGKPIDIDQLIDYDVDHIIPQSQVKDDSLNNKVLVHKTLNGKKDNTYPLPSEFRQPALWANLKKLKLLSDEKYHRLTRTTRISDLEKEKFINRQLVETSQMVKLTKDILQKYFEGITGDKKAVEIVMSKAGNVSDFRKDYGLTKSREINDFHHACDAYLNIVVGNVLNEKFSHNKDYRDNQSDKTVDKSYNFRKAFYSSVYSNREKRYVWTAQNKDGYYPTINVVKKELESFDFAMSKKLTTGKGQLYKETIFKAEDNPNMYPRVEKVDKNGVINPRVDVTKYGGLKTSGTAYFVVVDSEENKGKNKGQKRRSIIDIPIYYAKRIENGKTTINEYLETNPRVNLYKPTLAKIEGLKDSKLLVGSLLDFGNYKLRLAGAKEKVLTFHNANELFVSKGINDYVKELSLVNEKINKDFIKRKTDKGDLSDDEFRRKLFVEQEEEKTRRENDPEQKNKSKILHVTKEKNNELYNLFLDKVTNEKSPYAYLPAYTSFKNTLEKGKEIFYQMDEYDGLRCLLNLIVAFQCNAKTVDASCIGGSKEICRISTTKEITNMHVTFISQSVTGLKEKRIKIN